MSWWSVPFQGAVTWDTLETRESEFRGSRSAQLVIQKERWLLKQTMKNDDILIRVDLDFKNTFRSSLWKTLEEFGIPDVSLPTSIYERSTIRIQVRDRFSAAGSSTARYRHAVSRLCPVTPPRRLLHQRTSTAPRLHRDFPQSRRGPWLESLSFADDLSLYVNTTKNAQRLLNLVSAFQEWSGLKISIREYLVTGALHGKGEANRQRDAHAETKKRQSLDATPSRLQRDY